MAVKASRYLTHIQKLRGSWASAELFFTRLERLGDKLGPVLFQLPPTLRCDAGLLDDLLGSVPKGVRVAVEPRHPSWLTKRIEGVLTEHGAALCAADRRSQLQVPVWRTAPWGYVRLHEGGAIPRPCYGDTALRTWLDRIVETWGADDTYVLFNNDAHACAVKNASRLATLAGRAGVACSRASVAP
jgi:uncharacterized protein YecE (DUF72 family)